MATRRRQRARAQTERRHRGEIDVAGPELAGSLTASGLIDEYRLYFRPFVVGRGKPYFAGPVPALHLMGAEPVGEDAVRLTYERALTERPIAGVDVDDYVATLRRA
jgi:hypothetical protein